MAESEDEIIKKIYYEHFGSIKRTLKEARDQGKNIKEKDIKAWKDREISRKINLTGQITFVASRAEYFCGISSTARVPSGSLRDAHLDHHGYEIHEQGTTRPGAKDVYKSTEKKEG